MPLCPAVLYLGELGRLRLKAGDVVALLAGQVSHALKLIPMRGEAGYALVSWTEGRTLKLIEYDMWLHDAE